MTSWKYRRYYDFQNGHSQYLSFGLSFINFIVITYALAIERIPFLGQVFPSMIIWAVVFVFAYVPVATILGHYIYLKKQVPVIQELVTKYTPSIRKVVEGKEQDFYLPLERDKLKFNIKLMIIQNSIADALETFAKGSNNNNVSLPAIPRWSDDEIHVFAEWISRAERLQSGEDMDSITKS